MRTETFQIRRNINPHFYKAWITDKPYIVLKGGRGSFKSATVSLKLVTMMMHQIQKGRTVNVVCIRENANNLHDSVYNQITWALSLMHLTDQFRFRKSPLMIQHKQSGSTFYFYGADKPEKLKSNIVDNIIAVWFEEFANMKNVEVFDQSVPTFIRQKPNVPDIKNIKVFCTYNPPRNPYDWINEWISNKEHDDDYFIDHSTYLDDKLGFTTKQQLDLIEQYKKNDKDYYDWLYLGKVIGLGTNVYNIDLFNPVDSIPDDDYITDIYYGMDVGHEVSATAVVACGLSIKGNLYLLDTWYYSPAGKRNKKPPSELAHDIHDFIEEVSDQYDLDPTNMTMDSAEGALDNQYYQMYGVHWHKVNKLKNVDMIDRVQDLLAQGRFFYLNGEQNDIFIDEHKKYRWDEDTMQSDDPKVIKEHDHSVDAFKYLVLDNERDLGLKW